MNYTNPYIPSPFNTLILLGMGFACTAQTTIPLLEEPATAALCLIDPTCRRLTADEIVLVKPVFNDHFNPNPVRVFERRMLSTIWDEWLGNKKSGTAYANFAYLHNVDIKDQEQALKDGYKGYPNRPLTAHELAHVVQYQLKLPHTGYEKIYEVDMSQVKSFPALKAEQQATVVEQYVIRREEIGQLVSYFSTAGSPTQEVAKLAEACEAAKPYEAVLFPVFGTKAHPACLSLKLSS